MSAELDKIGDIVYRNLPCWYELSWKATKPAPAILLRIHNDFIKNAPIQSKDTPRVKILAEELRLQTFSGNFHGNIGFEEVFKHQQEKDGFTEFSITIPQISKPTNQDPYNMDWYTAFAISASFTVFSKLLKFYNRQDTSATTLQLLTIETVTQRGTYGGSLEVKIGFPLRQWLTQHIGQDSVPQMVQAMMIAHNRMFGLHDYDTDSFKMAAHQDGGLTLNCPGNTCGLGPDDRGKRDGHGCGLGDHNVDSPAQQLTLIAGLAALHDQARQAGC